jgi:hypothetical protein
MDGPGDRVRLNRGARKSEIVAIPVHAACTAQRNAEALKPATESRWLPGLLTCRLLVDNCLHLRWHNDVWLLDFARRLATRAQAHAKS